MGTTQIQNIDILFVTIIIFGFIILIAMLFGFAWLQDRIYDECREIRKEIREENQEMGDKIFTESQEIEKEIRETNNKIYEESQEIKSEIRKTKWN